jgi:hypothetical protein
MTEWVHFLSLLGARFTMRSVCPVLLCCTDLMLQSPDSSAQRHRLVRQVSLQLDTITDLEHQFN